MKLHRLLPVLAVFFAGCGTPLLILDNTSMPASEARVVIFPQYRFGKDVPDDLEIEITRVIDAKRRSSTFLRNIPNNRVSVISLEPGVYFLSTLNSGDHYRQHSIGSLKSVFEVKAGQLNYPGNWRLTGEVHSFRATGSAADGWTSTEYSLSFSVAKDDGVLGALRKSHPNTMDGMPLKFTGVDSTEQEGARRAKGE